MDRRKSPSKRYDARTRQQAEAFERLDALPTDVVLNCSVTRVALRAGTQPTNVIAWAQERGYTVQHEPVGRHGVHRLVRTS